VIHSGFCSDNFAKKVALLQKLEEFQPIKEDGGEKAEQAPSKEEGEKRALACKSFLLA
jgi:hypothetical protein